MKIGFIGAGNMASALIGGMLSAGTFKAEEISVSDNSEKALSVWREKGVCTFTDNIETVKCSDIIVFAVKPNIIPFVLDEIKDLTEYEDKIFISIAAGISIEFIENKLGACAKVVRTMPNTPAQVNCGMTVISPNKNITEDELKIVTKILESVGSTVVLDEKYMSVATALHGSSPAYIYMLIDAMADSGVNYGLTRDVALKLAAKAVEGSAKMVLETGIHPSQLKDNVCSPGGTTIAAVCDLEKSGFRASIQQAIDACVKKAEDMAK